MFDEFEFNDPPEQIITEICGISLPDDYLEFMRIHDGGMGPVGKYSYMVLFCLDELVELNLAYSVGDYYPGFVVFGNDGGEMILGYDSNTGKYCAFDECNISADEAFYVADSFLEFLETMDKALGDFSDDI